MAETDEIRRQLEEIVSKREYTQYHSEKNNWLYQVYEKILEQLAEWFPSFEVTSTRFDFTSVVVVLTVVCLLVVAAVLLIIRYRNKKRMSRVQAIGSMMDENWSYQQYEQEAHRLSAAGDYTGAVRHLFLAMLLYFETRGIITIRQAKTNWEYYDELTAVNEELAKTFYRCALMFDKATYGHHFVSDAEYSPFKEDVMQIIVGDSKVQEGVRHE